MNVKRSKSAYKIPAAYSKIMHSTESTNQQNYNNISLYL